jgi:5-methyltetrahydrofolate--homocysteine methyltransferase
LTKKARRPPRGKIRICERAYRSAGGRSRLSAGGHYFDPNILTVGTGIEEHNNYAVDFIEATRWIKQNLPHAKVSGGVSNVSFGFRGNNPVREAMHSAFLFTPSAPAWTWASSTPACWKSMRRSSRN